ncbi:hypothetical protein D3C76_1169630 [compost metagenome]
MTFSLSPRLVTMMNCRFFNSGCWRHQVSSSRPDISGISQSHRTRSNASLPSMAMALRPLTASSMVMPGKALRRHLRTRSRINGASSTTSTFTLLIDTPSESRLAYRRIMATCYNLVTPGLLHIVRGCLPAPRPQTKTPGQGRASMLGSNLTYRQVRPEH